MKRPSFCRSDLQALYDKGFTLIWLKEKSKAPIEPGWTKKPRTDFETFWKAYRPGYNVGVRLGSASKLDTGFFLAVLDVDVKGLEARHQAEARAKLFELFPEAKESPCVISGRGNGSGHYYVCTTEPISGGERKAQSSEVVKVKMPSVKASRKELDTLTKAELNAGMRLRPAWEISLLSEGRQVVLPGSVHPDTGRVYAWAKGAK